MKRIPISYLEERLETIITTEPDTIRSKVAKEALEYGVQEVKAFFNDLLSHGCRSGMIGPLIYYSDTHAFFEEHYNEIEELRFEYQEQTGQPLYIKDDLKNTLAWFGFEETARKMAEELRLEI